MLSNDIHIAYFVSLLSIAHELMIIRRVFEYENKIRFFVPVVTGNEWPLRSIVIIRSIQIIFFNFKEFSQTLYWPLGFTYQDMSYRVALDRSTP